VPKGSAGGGKTVTRRVHIASPFPSPFPAEPGGRPGAYSHSMVAGGFDEMS